MVEGRGEELRNVAKAVFRGRKINCKACLGNGATLGCNVKACRNSYHLPCALAKGCHLQARTLSPVSRLDFLLLYSLQVRSSI